MTTARVRPAAASRLAGDPEWRVTVLAQRRVEVDGREVEAHLADLGDGHARLELDGRETRLVLGAAARTDRGPLAREVLVDGFRFLVEVEPDRQATLRERATRGRADSGATGSLELRAVIPGKVVAISVAVGDTVTGGQQLLVIEAMKMQNEIRAPGDGRVERIAVADDGRIEIGDLLVVIGREAPQ